MEQMVKHPFLLFLSIAIGPFLVGVDLLAIGIAAEPMHKELAITIATLQWFLTGYSIGNSSFLITSGRLADMYGRKKMFMIGTLIFILSSTVIAITSSPLVIIIARLIQGASGGILPTVGIAILITLYSPSERTRWLAGLVGAAGLGMALGPVIGGLLIHHFGWRSVFLINIPFGLLGMLLSFIFIPKTAAHTTKQKLDFVGIILFTAILIIFTMAVSEGHYWGWTSLKTIGFFILDILLIFLFIYAESKFSQPLIEFSLFKIKNFLAANIVGGLLMFTMTGWLLVFGIYLERVAGMTPQKAGLSLLPFGVVLAIVSSKMHVLYRMFGSKNLIVIGYVFGIIAFLGMSLLSTFPAYWILVILFVMYGLSFTLVNSNSIPAALEFMPLEKSGLVSGKAMMMRWLGGALGAAIITTVFVGQSISKMQKLTASDTEFSTPGYLKTLHDVITGQSSLSLMPSVFQGNLLTKAHSIVAESYHYGLTSSMIVLCALCVLALFVAQFGIAKK